MPTPDALDTVFDPVYGPLEFYPGVREWFAAFKDRHAGKRIEAIPHELGRAL
jgi:hypothetical protein